ncbi:hypothetical protein [Streptomyces sp. NPDC059552]|uniref:hypothetical protein n=1 Tax=Streptomyces sp. NPDC059552 TaxID=3346862 RepID=UPI00367F91B5
MHAYLLRLVPAVAVALAVCAAPAPAPAHAGPQSTAEPHPLGVRHRWTTKR